MTSTEPENEALYTPAEYRVRIFLSVDLSGSTAFKNSRVGEDHDNGPTPRWVDVFQDFYSRFPVLFQTHFASQRTALTGDDAAPSLWKAVGDELVFCGCVSNKRSVVTAVNAFVDTLHDYRSHLREKDYGLDLKGCSWLAAFPVPNRAVQLRPKEGTTFISATEALEAAADADPFSFDFLGKAIDSGFRIAHAATPERFILCAQLARLIASTEENLGFSHQIRLDQPTLLKGVNRGEPYPILYIDTMAHLPSKSLRQKERALLNRHKVPEKADLAAYLREYCNLVSTDEIMLRDSSPESRRTPPESYTRYQSAMSEHLKQEKEREYSGDEQSGPEPENGSIPDSIPETNMHPLATTNEAVR